MDKKDDDIVTVTYWENVTKKVDHPDPRRARNGVQVDKVVAEERDPEPLTPELFKRIHEDGDIQKATIHTAYGDVVLENGHITDIKNLSDQATAILPAAIDRETNAPFPDDGKLTPELLSDITETNLFGYTAKTTAYLDLGNIEIETQNGEIKGFETKETATPQAESEEPSTPEAEQPVITEKPNTESNPIAVTVNDTSGDGVTATDATGQTTQVPTQVFNTAALGTTDQQLQQALAPHAGDAIKTVQAYMVHKGIDLGDYGPDGNGIDGHWGPATDAGFAQLLLEVQQTEAYKTAYGEVYPNRDTADATPDFLPGAASVNAMENLGVPAEVIAALRELKMDDRSTHNDVYNIPDNTEAIIENAKSSAILDPGETGPPTESQDPGQEQTGPDQKTKLPIMAGNPPHVA